MHLFRPLRKVFHRPRISRHFNFVSRVQVGKRPFEIPILGTAGLQNLEQQEGWLIPLMSELIAMKPGDFVDVGMNVGQTLLKYWSLGLTGRTYYGFEPNPSAVSYLYRLVRENGASNVHIIPAGLSDHTGIASFFMKTEYDPGASAVAGFRQADQYSIERYIAVFKGDDVIAGLNIAAISMLKIDVEGGELEVLVGLESTISRTRPFISCEVLPIRDESTEIGKMRRQRADRVQAFVASHNYAICRVLKKGGGIELLDRIPTHDDLDLCDYLFIPKENLEAVLNRLKPGTANRAAQAAE